MTQLIHRLASPARWMLLLWGTELAVSYLVAQSGLPLLSGFSDSELAEPGGLLLLEALRVNLDGAWGALARAGQLALTWLLGSLPLSFLLYAAAAQTATQNGASRLNRGMLPALLRFTALTLLQRATELLLVALLGAGAFAALRSTHSLRIEAALILTACWVLGRGLPAAYFDLARLASTSGSALRIAHRSARSSLARRTWGLWLSRSLVGPASLAFGLCALLVLEHALTRPLAEFTLGFAGAEFLLLGAQVAHTLWLLGASATLESEELPAP